MSARSSKQKSTVKPVPQVGQFPVVDETDPERDRILHEVQCVIRDRPTPNASAAALRGRRNVLWALGAAGRRGLSKKELIAVTQCSWTNIQKRLDELLKQGKIEEAGRAVWRMVPEKAERRE